MTRASEGTALRFADLPSAVAALRAAGLRVTAARRLVLDALFAAEGPCSAEQIARAVGGEDAEGDAASVYRNLEAFERCGIVRHVHLGHGPGLYALVGEGEREYLHCEYCGATRAVAPAELDAVRELVRERFGWQARFSHFPIVGRCPRCADGGAR
jgi:Fur family transcriptional regulator, ferric uptake regulator